MATQPPASKRARTEGRAATIPAWLRESGLTDPVLVQLLTWMDGAGLCLAKADVIQHKIKSHDHPVDCVTAVEYDESDSPLRCDGCLWHCECCGVASVHRFKLGVDEAPHDAVCARCYNFGRPLCTHPFPYTCPCCNMGCMSLEYVEPEEGGGHRQRCANCITIECEHQA